MSSLVKQGLSACVNAFTSVFAMLAQAVYTVHILRIGLITISLASASAIYTTGS